MPPLYDMLPTATRQRFSASGVHTRGVSACVAYDGSVAVCLRYFAVHWMAPPSG